jgi:ATP-binding protein involved in chromosome partitioning
MSAMSDPTSAPDRNAVYAALDAVTDPKSGQGLMKAGLVRGLTLAPGRAGFMLEVGAQDAALYAPVRDQAEAALRALPGVERAQVVLTAEARPAHGHGHGHAPARGARLSDAAVDQQRRAAPVPAGRPEHVRAVVAVASGKGGVGKSTVAVNLACALAQLGLRAGLLDADIYGPSAPLMLGLEGAPEIDQDKKILPKPAFGVKAMSIGLMVNAEQAMIWRGPMATQALSQMLLETRWGSADEPLDVLVVDLPPGTGDVQLTLVQKTKIDGAVIVSTPQEAALADVRRAATMFAKVSTPVLGLVENMAYFPDPATGAPIEIFGRGGARAEAERTGLPFLGELPIDIDLRKGADAGRPLTAVSPDSATAKAFLGLAEKVRDRVL